MSSPTKLAPQYQFAAPKLNQGGRLWTINRINEPTPYICLRAQLSQVILNPLTLGCSLLAIFVHISYLIAQAELQMLANSGSSLCQEFTNSSIYSSQADILPILANINSSTTALAKLGLDSYVTIVTNLGESALRHYTLDVNSFSGLVQSIPQSVNLGISKEESTVDNWLSPRLAKAQNMSSVLLKAFSEVGAALQTSGIYSLNQQEVTDVFNISLPHFDNIGPNTINFTSVSSNTSDALTRAVNQAVNQATAQLSNVNISSLVLPKMNITRNSTTKCDTILQQFDEIRTTCSRAKNVSIAVYCLMAVFAILISCCVKYLNWRNMNNNVKVLKESVSGYETDAVIDPMVYFYDSNNYITTKMKKICAKIFEKQMHRIYAQWAVSYLSTATMNTWLLVSAWMMLLAIPTEAMSDALKHSNNKLVAKTMLNSVDFSAISSSLNDQISMQESEINDPPKMILLNLFNQLNNLLKNAHDDLSNTLSDYLARNSINLQVDIPFVQSMERVAAPTISIPRVSAETLLNDFYQPFDVSSSSSGPNGVLSKICVVLWTTFGVIVGMWLLWIVIALVYTYYAAKITQKATGIFSTANRAHKIVVAEPKSEPPPVHRPAPAPPLPARNTHRPNYFI